MAEIDVVDELQKADELRQRGILSQQEFDAYKAKLSGSSEVIGVSGSASPPPPAPSETPPNVRPDEFAAYRELAPGWYKDRADSSMARYWDGTRLSDESRPIPQPGGESPSRERGLRSWTGLSSGVDSTATQRAKVKQRFHAAIQALLEPGEQVLAETRCQSGPSPWLTRPLGLLLAIHMGMRPYFIVVTDRRILFMRVSLVTGRPKGLAWADPKAGAQFHDTHLGNVVWSKTYYRRPDGEDIRLNIHRFWLEDGQSVVAAVGGS